MITDSEINRPTRRMRQMFERPTHAVPCPPAGSCYIYLPTLIENSATVLQHKPRGRSGRVPLVVCASEECEKW